MGVTVKRMNRAARFAVAIGVGLTAVEAQAGSVTVTFGALPNAVAIESYYNGGLSGYPPAGKGPDLGLVFSSLANEQKATTTNPPPRPGTGKFENNPSGAAGVLYFPYSPTTDSYVDDAAGFTSLTFTYSLLNNALPPRAADLGDAAHRLRRSRPGASSIRGAIREPRRAGLGRRPAHGFKCSISMKAKSNGLALTTVCSTPSRRA